MANQQIAGLLNVVFPTERLDIGDSKRDSQQNKTEHYSVCQQLRFVEVHKKLNMQYF